MQSYYIASPSRIANTVKCFNVACNTHVIDPPQGVSYVFCNAKECSNMFIDVRFGNNEQEHHRVPITYWLTCEDLKRNIERLYTGSSYTLVFVTSDNRSIPLELANLGQALIASVIPFDPRGYFHINEIINSPTLASYINDDKFPVYICGLFAKIQEYSAVEHPDMAFTFDRQTDGLQYLQTIPFDLSDCTLTLPNNVFIPYNVTVKKTAVRATRKALVLLCRAILKHVSGHIQEDLKLVLELLESSTRQARTLSKHLLALQHKFEEPVHKRAKVQESSQDEVD
jgi:hypothetical protein